MFLRSPLRIGLETVSYTELVRLHCRGDLGGGWVGSRNIRVELTHSAESRTVTAQNMLYKDLQCELDKQWAHPDVFMILYMLASL